MTVAGCADPLDAVPLLPAPARTQLAKAAIWAALGCGSFAGGMCSSLPSGKRRRVTIELLSGLPGTSAAPSAPPFSRAAVESTRSLPFCLLGP